MPITQVIKMSAPGQAFVYSCEIDSLELAKRALNKGMVASYDKYNHYARVYTITLCNALTKACTYDCRDIIWFVLGLCETNKIKPSHEELYFAAIAGCKMNDMVLIDNIAARGFSQWSGVLSYCCHFGHIEAAKAVMRYVDVNEPIIHASAYIGNHLEIFKLLQFNGAKFEQAQFDFAISRCCSLEIARLLFSHVKFDDIRALFMRACSSGTFEIIQFLHQKGATNINEGFVEACVRMNRGAVHYLKNAGADAFNEALRRVCARHKDPEMADLLIKWGAYNLNEALMATNANGSMIVVKYLIARGANNLPDCLAAACRDANTRVIDRIFELNALIQCPNCHRTREEHAAVPPDVVEIAPLPEDE